MKQVLIYSIHATHIMNILNGKKTIEVRKRDLPQWAKEKLERGEFVEAYGYCTMGKPRLFKLDGIDDYNISNLPPFYGNTLNGKVVVKFQVSGVTKYVDCSDCTNNDNGYECQNEFMYLLSVDPVLRKATCLNADEIEEYGNGKDLYAHILTNVTPIEPMELSEFMTATKWHKGEDGLEFEVKTLKKAPQSFQTAWVKGE